LRVTGVSNEELVAFCKTLSDTGCGYYPNSSFVHVDVRLPGTGSVSWIDASGPGEPPRYVTQWPPPEAEEPPPFVPPAQAEAPQDDKRDSSDDEGSADHDPGPVSMKQGDIAKRSPVNAKQGEAKKPSAASAKADGEPVFEESRAD
jgi:hypothetical protein